MSMTQRQLAGNQRRTLRAMRARLLSMAADWDEIDQFNVSKLTEIADTVEVVAAEMVPDEDLPA